MKKYNTNRKGFAIVEATISSAVLLIAVMGTMKFDYYSAIDSYRSQCQLEGCMLGSAVMESWQGQGGTLEFNPAQDLSDSIMDCGDVSVSGAYFGPGIPAGFTISYDIFPYYKITINGTKFRVALSYKFIDGYKYLNVRVGWANNLDGGYWKSRDYVGITECLH
ncbi:hypothetical protein [Sedimentisphaera salicampi]|uniref:hypothetical protein n=1 Tax=Sedimentisphaera salicampi TaxID=1941349 RepID=UPI000B9C54AB|nr:hypothetical protein [Sedimentisphaera salicampi]OXU16144.1 hypothetical protein SMSP1_00084 [Sedimentisphaera salicampi]